MASGTVQIGLIEKVQINNDTQQRIASTAYGVCSTIANTAEKVVQIDGFELMDGVTIHVKFTHDNTASTPPTLNVNGTGAINMVQYNNIAVGTTSETSGWQAGAVISFTYDGTYWVRDQGYNTNTVYTTVNANAAGLVPQIPNDTTKFLRGDASWSVLPVASSDTAGITTVGASGGAAAYSQGVPPIQTANNITFLRNDNSWFKLTKDEVSTLINLLDTDTLDLTANDYIVTQSAGGGTTYYRRAASKIVNTTLVKLALNTNNTHDNAFLRKDGTWQTPPYPVTSVNGTTGDVVITASSLGLSNALHFIGIVKNNSTYQPSDGTNGTPEIIGINNYSPVSGDVILDKIEHFEYVYTSNNTWERLGGDDSYKIVQTAVSTATASTETTTRFVSSVTQNEQGVITVTTKLLDTSGTWSGNATTATTATNLAAKPSLAAGSSDAKKITITAGGKTSDEFTVPYATQAKYIIATDDAASWAGALLHSNSARSNTADTWIFADDKGSASSNYGIKHDQTNDTIVFIGGNTARTTIYLGQSKITATTFDGNATTATAIQTAGTTGQFYRGDNTWSNSLYGPFNVFTSTDEAKAFSICRSSTSEATKIWVDDNYTRFYVENDETSANIHFRLHATDTESGDGTNASTANIYFYGSENLSTIEADKFTKGYGILYLNTKINKRPSGAAITQPNTDVNPVELVSFAASGSDFGIVHISNDGCYVCNSADVGWAFAVFDTDKTVDFSTADNASFYVKQNQEGAVFIGTVTADSFSGSLTGNVTGNIVGNVTGNATTATTLQNARTLWGQSFNGSANISGNMTNVGPQLKLPSGNTAFGFYTSNSGVAGGLFGHIGIGSTYANLTDTTCALEVQGSVSVTDTIYRTYSASNGTPMIWMNSPDYDNYLWQISSGTTTKQYYGYGLKYIGTGSNATKYLRLIADHQNGTDVTAIGINNDGQVGIGTDASTSYRLQVSGNTYFNGNTTTNGVVYFANDTTYYINNSAVGYLPDLRVDKIRLEDDYIGFYSAVNAGTSQNGYIQVTDATHMYFRLASDNSSNLFDFNGDIVPKITNKYNLGSSSYRWKDLYLQGDLFMQSMDTPTSYPATANKISWSGGEDQATIYYKLTAANKGRLFINTVSGNNANTDCLIVFSDEDNEKININTKTPSFYPETTNTGQLGLTDKRWSKVYIGSSDSYGADGASGVAQPIYWNNGVPAPITNTIGDTTKPVYFNSGKITALTTAVGNRYTPIYYDATIGMQETVVVQKVSWYLVTGNDGIRISHLTDNTAFTSNSIVTAIVVTSGEENLTAPLQWYSTDNYIELHTSEACTGNVYGYILVTRGEEVSDNDLQYVRTTPTPLTPPTPPTPPPTP